jgi:hypothetical protein
MTSKDKDKDKDKDKGRGKGKGSGSGKMRVLCCGQNDTLRVGVLALDDVEGQAG